MPDLKKIIPPSLLYHLKLISVPMVGLCILLAIKLIVRGYIDPFVEDRPWEGDWFILPPALYFFSLPVVFAFWIYALRDDHRFAKTFSIAACLLSAASFMLAIGLDMKEHEAIVIGSTLIGCIAGCFIFINYKEFYRHAFRDERITCVAIIGACTSTMYGLMDHYLWERMAYSAAKSSQWLLELFPIDVLAGITKEGEKIITIIASSNFKILVYRGCSGLEGIFLFVFLLSVAVLLDWKNLKRIHLIETYLTGFIFMYLANVLRLVSLFLLGHFSHAPDASPLLASMRGLPIHVFHSFIGQIYYILVFILFAHLLYAYVTPEKKHP